MFPEIVQPEALNKKSLPTKEPEGEANVTVARNEVVVIPLVELIEKAEKLNSSHCKLKLVSSTQKHKINAYLVNCTLHIWGRS